MSVKRTYQVAIVLEIEAESHGFANDQVIDWWSSHREGNALEIFPEGYVDGRVETNTFKDTGGDEYIKLDPPSFPIDAEPADVSDDAVLIEDKDD